MIKKTIIGFLLLLGIKILCSSYMDILQANEYDVKAAYIYNFTKYINWNQDFNNSSSFSIGIYGNSPIKESLKEISQTKSFQNKKVVIKQYDNLEDLEKCHIVYVPVSTNSQKLKSVLSHQNCTNSLVITEKEGNIQYGSVINFVTIENKIKFEISLKEAKARELETSSQLLKMALKVYQ